MSNLKIIVLSVFSLFYCLSAAAFDPRGESKTGSADDIADRKTGTSKSYSAPTTNELRERVETERAQERSQAEAAIERARQDREDSFRGRDDNDYNISNDENKSSPFSDPTEQNSRFNGILGLADIAKNVAAIAKNKLSNLTESIQSNPHVEAYKSGISRARANVSNIQSEDYGENSKDRNVIEDDYLREFYSGVARAYEAKGLKPDIQPIPSGPMQIITRSSKVPKSADFYDPRHNQDIYSGTGSRRNESRYTDTTHLIDQAYRAGKIDVSVPGSELRLNRAEVFTGYEDDYDPSLVQKELGYVTKTQRVGLLESITLVGELRALEEITTTFQPIKMKGSSTADLFDPRKNDPNFGTIKQNIPTKMGSASNFKYSGAFHIPKDFAGTAKGGIIAIPTSAYVDGEKKRITEDRLYDVIVHEANHAGEYAILNDAKQKLENAIANNASEDEIDYLSNVEFVAETTYYRHLTEEFIENQERIDNGFGIQFADPKIDALVKETFGNDSYLNNITEARAYSAMKGGVKTYAEFISYQSGIDLETANVIAETIINSDVMKYIDDVIEGHATEMLNEREKDD